MIKKTAIVTARINSFVKEQAEAILSRLSVSQTAVIDMLYRQIIAHNGIPFPVTLPVSVQDFDRMLIPPYPFQTAPPTEGQPSDPADYMTDLPASGSESYYDYGSDAEGNNPSFETDRYGTGEYNDNYYNTLDP